MISQCVRAGLNGGECLTSFLVDSGNGRTGQQVMKLIEQQLFPQLAQFPSRIPEKPVHVCRRTPEFCFMEGNFAPAAPLFQFRLRGVCTTMPLQIQLTHVSIFWQPPPFDILKKRNRGSHPCARGPFQIFHPPRKLHKVAGCPPAAVSKTEWEQKRVNVLLLMPVFFPSLVQKPGVNGRIVFKIKMRKDTGAVHAFPPKNIIGERITFRQAPQQLLCSEIPDAASSQDLRQRRSKAKGIR